jgi:Cys-tRNA(Pro)/Cys-tRNA(Cys) deacylase
MVATPKTNAVRLLERLGVSFELRKYEVDPEDLAAETVARKVGMPSEQVFKTLVARADKHGVCLAVVPGNCELDVKALARASGDKKIETVALREVEPLTGYVRGGVTALACKKNYPVYLDETAQPFDVISISAGMRGLQVLLAPDEYVRVTNAKLAPIAKDKEQKKILASRTQTDRLPLVPVSAMCLQRVADGLFHRGRHCRSHGVDTLVKNEGKEMSRP